MFKKITAFLLVMVLSAGVGFAAGSGQNITVYYDAVKKILIDGVDKTPSDVRPFVYQGSTYVPLRYIAEQLGKPVQYDAVTQTVYIGSKPVTLAVEKKPLFQLPSSGLYNVYVYRFDNSTVPALNMDNDAQFDYPSGYMMTYRTNEDALAPEYQTLDNGLSLQVSTGNNAFFYRTNQGYDHLSGRVGYDGKLNRVIYPATVRVIVDDVVRQEIKLDAKKRTADIDAVLTQGNVLKLEFVVEDYNSTKETYLNLTDMTLEKYTYK